MDDKEFDYLNVIPLVDIMLVLLTIVLTTSTFIVSGGIPVNLPRGGESSAESIQSQIIEIDRDGRVYLNAVAVSLSDLGESVRRLDRSTAVLIRADRTITLQSFVDVLDMVKTLGFTRVHLQTESRI